MKCKICGNELFMGHQQCYHDIIVDGDNNFEEDNGIYEHERPYGPYQCCCCGAEYEELNEKCILNYTEVYRFGPIQEPVSKIRLLKADWVKRNLHMGTIASPNGIQQCLDNMTQEDLNFFFSKAPEDAVVVLKDETEEKKEPDVSEKDMETFYKIQCQFDLEALKAGFLRKFFDINTDVTPEATPSDEQLEEFKDSYGMSFDDFFEANKESALQKMLETVSLATYEAAEDAAAAFE